MIHYKCPKCGEEMRSPDSPVGQVETCPVCGNVTVVPKIQTAGPGKAAKATPVAQISRKQCPKCKELIDKNATKCPYCRSTQPAPRWAIGLALVFLVVCFIICTGIFDSGSSVPEYEIVDKDTYDTPLKTQIVLDAVVSGAITEQGLRQLLQQLYDEVSETRGFKYHGGKPTHVFIYLYTSRDHFQSSSGQWVAMLSKCGEDSQISTDVKNEFISQLNAKPEVKYGLTEEHRKGVFKLLIKAEDRASTEAKQRYPVDTGRTNKVDVVDQLKRQTDLYNTLATKYKAGLGKQYNLTEEQIRTIAIEGIQKNWPMPK